MKISEFLFTCNHIAAIEYVYVALESRAGAKLRSAIADPMLRACKYAQRIIQIVALVSAHRSLTHHARELRRLAKTFVRPAPTLVTRHSHARRESPVDARCFDFGRSDTSRAFHQIRIARATETDVVWKEDGAKHVAVTVDGVDTVKKWNTQTGVLRATLQAVVVIGPVFQPIAALRIGAAATEHRTEKQLFDVAYVVERSLVDLHHLAHLLLHRHPRQQLLRLCVMRSKITEHVGSRHQCTGNRKRRSFDKRSSGYFHISSSTGPQSLSRRSDGPCGERLPAST